MVDAVKSVHPNDQCAQLEVKLQEAKDKQGAIGSIWNGVKELTGLGLSEKTCEKKLEEFQKGKICFEEAAQYIESYEKKQDNVTNLVENVATGVGSIAVATVAAAGTPVGLGSALLKGAPVGAAIKTGLDVVDKATNDVEGDINAKTIAKDVIQGGYTGFASAVSTGAIVGKAKTGTLLETTLRGAECGAILGSAGGALNYTTDAVLDDDKEFNFGDLTKNTLKSGAFSAVSGGIVGAGVHGFENIFGEATNATIGQQIIADASASSAKKIVGQMEQNIFQQA